jgi:hypothetical protein
MQGGRGQGCVHAAGPGGGVRVGSISLHSTRLQHSDCTHMPAATQHKPYDTAPAVAAMLHWLGLWGSCILRIVRVRMKRECLTFLSPLRMCLSKVGVGLLNMRVVCVVLPPPLPQARLAELHQPSVQKCFCGVLTRGNESGLGHEDACSCSSALSTALSTSFRCIRLHLCHITACKWLPAVGVPLCRRSLPQDAPGNLLVCHATEVLTDA